MKPDRDAPIGVFDSGVGGLTVAREIMRNLPSEKSYILEIQPEYLWRKVQREYYPVFQTDHSFSYGAAGQGNCDRLQYGKRFCPGGSEG